MRTKLQKLHAIVAITTALILATGCSQKPHLPPVNPHPTQKIVLKIHTDMAPRRDTRKATPTYVEVQYTPTDHGCGYVEHTFINGDIYRRPEKDVIFMAHNGVVTIYRDYFEKRKKCPARINGAVIHIAGPDGLPSYMDVDALVVDSRTRNELRAVCDYEKVFQQHICWGEDEIGTRKLAGGIQFTIDVQRLNTR